MSEYEYDYDRIVEDTDELYEDDYDDIEYAEDDISCWDNYYHNIANEIDDE